MRIVSIERCLFLSLFLMSGVLFAQKNPLGSETVTVVKPYTPSVGDANKIKEMPVKADSVSLQKKPVKYSIFSVPVASTFTPAKGRATNVERERREKVYDNYATLGFGNYTRALAEFYSNLEVNRTDNFGIFLTHNSSQGGIEGVKLDDKYYDTELNLSYNSKNRDLGWKTELGGEHKLFNWYGIMDGTSMSDEEILAIDPQQNYFSVYAGGEIELYDSFFDHGKAKFTHTGDSYSSSENHFDANAIFEVNIADELITTNLTADLVNGSFDRSYLGQTAAPKYTFLNFGVNPSLLILRDDLTLNLGVSLFYSLDAENSDSKFYFYPEVTASYRLAGDYFIPYAGVEGKLRQNTYYNFIEQNPYVSPTLNVKPTDEEYNAYVGAKGKLSNAVSYNLKVGYESDVDKALFQHNPYAAAVVNEDYAHGNSFGVVYDDMQTLSFSGELNVDVNRDFRLGLNADYFSYSMGMQREAWNLPNIKASLNADYQITEKWYTGGNIFFVGERKDLNSYFYGTGTEQQPEVITLDSYFDLNAHLGYRFNDQLSIFVKGNNLLNNDYEKWTNFQVQGIQVLAGATYKFDF